MNANAQVQKSSAAAVQSSRYPQQEQPKYASQRLGRRHQEPGADQGPVAVCGSRHGTERITLS